MWVTVFEGWHFFKWVSFLHTSVTTDRQKESTQPLKSLDLGFSILLIQKSENKGKICADHQIIDSRAKSNTSGREFSSVKPAHKKASSFADSKFSDYYSSCPKKRNRNDREWQSISSNNSMSSLKPTSDRKVGKKSICSAISNKNRLKSSSSKTSLRKAESKIIMIWFDWNIDFINLVTKDIKKVEMISSSKAITCNLLYKIIKLKNITINERNILSKFCQLINEWRLDESHESKSYKSVKSQQMFIERSIYFLGNEALLISK